MAKQLAQCPCSSIAIIISILYGHVYDASAAAQLVYVAVAREAPHIHTDTPTHTHTPHRMGPAEMSCFVSR